MRFGIVGASSGTLGLPTGIGEFDRALGGGLVAGGVILILLGGKILLEHLGIL